MGREREREREQEGEDVGLGASVCRGGALHIAHAGVADSDTGEKPISRVWQLPDKWSFHTGSFHPLLCHYLHLLISSWYSHVHWLIASTINTTQHLQVSELVRLLCAFCCFLSCPLYLYWP